MGRNKQPVNLILLKGKSKHLTKEEIEHRKSTEVKAPSGNVRAPDYLSKELKREFKKIADQLKRIDLIADLDVDTLARYLLSREQYIKLSHMLQVTDLRDIETYATILLQQDKFFKQCRQGAADIGLTISSRCRIVVPKKEPKKKSEDEELFGGAL